MDQCTIVSTDNLFLGVGAGTRREICWMKGRPMSAVAIESHAWLEELGQLTKALNKALEAAHLERLGDIGAGAHFLCELDKWVRGQRSSAELAAWGAVRYTRMRKPEERTGLAALRRK